MDATRYLVLIEVHFRSATFYKGQRLTIEEMGPCAFALLHYGIATPVTADLSVLLNAA